jgi:anthranilate phosphoribosyltransferase
MLVGVPRPGLCEPFARVLQSLGARRAMVVCGAVPGTSGERRYIDELSSLGPTTIAEFYQERALACSNLAPDLFPLQPAVLADIRGGDREANAEIVRRILRGEERGPKRDIVLLNAAAALFVACRAPSMLAGWDLAAKVIDEGQAARKLEELTQSRLASG